MTAATVQPSLFDDTLDARFARFHAEHPEVYAKLVVLARRAKARGFERIGISLLFEQLRWELGPHEFDERGYRLNNVLRSRYAREIMRREPDLRGLFTTRRLAGERRR